MFNFLHRLYRNETRLPFIARRKWFYAASGVLIVIFVLSFIFRGFNEGVEFAGGTQFQIPVSNTSLTVDQVRSEVWWIDEDGQPSRGHVAIAHALIAGSG